MCGSRSGSEGQIMRHVGIVMVAILLGLAIEPMVVNQVASAKPSKHEQGPETEGLPDEFPEQVQWMEASPICPRNLAGLSPVWVEAAQRATPVPLPIGNWNRLPDLARENTGQMPTTWIA
jgi:hypothetical protein